MSWNRSTKPSNNLSTGIDFILCVGFLAAVDSAMSLDFFLDFLFDFCFDFFLDFLLDFLLDFVSVLSPTASSAIPSHCKCLDISGCLCLDFVAFDLVILFTGLVGSTKVAMIKGMKNYLNTQRYS